MSPNTPLTDEQRNAVSELRAKYTSLLATLQFGTAESVEERTRLPDPGTIPADVTVCVEIAPPSPHPHPLLPSAALKTPERVPIYFYSLASDPAASDAELADTRVVFFIHGGGNVIGHPTQAPFVQFYIQLLRAIASHSEGDGAGAGKCVLIAPSYRLATVSENAFPAALQDIVAAYDYVLGKGYHASNVVVAGDSAGGNHAIVLTHLILQSSRPLPRGVIAIAPASKLSDGTGEHAGTQAGNDTLDVSEFKRMTSMYIGNSGVSPSDPLVSGAFLPFGASWPRTLILVGTADQLIDGSCELKKRLAALNRPVELVEYYERPHGWWVMPHLFAVNIQDAVQRIARFVLS